MKWYKRLRKKYRVLHILLVTIAIVMLWRGTWGLLDVFLFPNNELISSTISLLVAFLVLYFDDFHLRELE